MTSITEGKATIPVPAATAQEVFYNPIQEFNRDMSIAAINVWSKIYLEETSQKSGNPCKKPRGGGGVELSNQKEINILEGLSATGLRAIRYAKECDNIAHIVANDFDASAAEAIKKNAEFNNVLGKVIPNEGDANMVMFQSIQKSGFGLQGLKFLVVDLDPYGSAAPFIDAAVRSIASGGLLCVTCTDMAVLAGSQWDACWAKYGSMPVPNATFCHEMALRMLLAHIQTSCAKYGRRIEPLMSCSIDFYVRVFLQVIESPAESKMMVAKSSMIYSCVGCRAHTIFPMGSYETSGKSVKFKNPSFPKDLGSTCQICDSKFHVGGPFYSGRIHNPDFVSKMIAYVKETCPPAEGVDKKFGTHVRMLGMLTVISEELHDIALFYGLDAICQALHCVVPQMKVFFSAVVNAGYKISGSHCNPTAFKTDAPNSVVWDILRSWIKKNPVSQKRLVAGAVATKILAKEPILAANFTFNQSAIPKSKKSDGKNETGDAKKAHVVRFAPNPTKNWGPKSKAKPNSGQLKPFSGKDTAIIGEKRHREDE